MSMNEELREARAEIERLTAALKESPTKPLEETGIGKDREIARLRAALTNARAAIYNLKDPDVSDWQFENSSLTQQIDAALGVEQAPHE